MARRERVASATRAGPTASGSAGAEPGDGQVVAALARGLAILRCFGPGDRWLGNQEMAERTGLAKPTVARLSQTLTRLGYLRHSGTLKKYSLGTSAVGLGYAALSQMDARSLARPLMQTLAEQTQVCVNLGVNDGLSMIYIDRYANAASYTVQLDVGSRVPVANTSIGRAYLCGLAEPARQALVEELRHAHAADWAKVKRGIDQALRDHEERGYCLALGDWRPEVHAIAAPLVSADGSPPVVFSCTGPSFVLTPDKIREVIGPRLVALVGNVRYALAAQAARP